MTLNCRSLRKQSKRKILEALVVFENYDIMILTETWYTDDFNDAMIQINRYNLALRADRVKVTKKTRGGGVAIYVKKGIKFHTPKILNIKNQVQVASLKIKDLRIVGIYRAPDTLAGYDSDLKDYVFNTFNEDNVLIAGDLNLRGVDWDRGVYPTGPSKLWGDLVSEMELEQTVRGATQKYGNQLDCIFTRSNSAISASPPFIDNMIYNVITDHYAIVTNVNICFQKEVVKKQVVDYKRADWDLFKEKTSDTQLIVQVLNSQTNDESWDSVTKVLSSARNDSCPLIEVKEGNAPKWIGQKLQAKLQKSRRLRVKINQPSTMAVKRLRVQKFKSFRNHLHNEIKSARVSYEKKRIEDFDGNPYALFATIKKARTVNMASPPINDMDGFPLTSDKSKAEAFQKKFLTVFTAPNNTVIDWPQNWGLNNVVFTLAKVEKAINKLKRSSAPGADNIGPVLYKECHSTVREALVLLFNNIMSTADIPKAFLQSMVIALWKNKGSISDIDTFRQITLSCTGVKIFESVIIADINDHLETHNLIDEWQHGFQKRKSTITNLLSSWEFLSHQVDQGESWISLSLDFSCAFDKASIFHILKSLKRKGIGGNLGLVLEKYLKGRSQFVKVGNDKSSADPCTSGVAQGSIGGPQLFCCLLSDVFESLIEDGSAINAKLFAFADDSRILFQMKNETQRSQAQTFLDITSTKIKEAGLSLNASKSVIVKYGNRNFSGDLKIEGCVIPVQNESLELGCLMSNSMTFKSQIERNVSKASKFIFIIRNTLNARNYRTLKKLYQVYFCPILLYASPIWISDYKYARDSLLAAYRLFWRLGNNIIRPGPEILDPFQLAIKQSLTFMFQMREGKNCLKFDDFFIQKESTVTRSDLKGDLFIQRNRTQSRNSFFTTYMAKWYNKLPLSVKQCKSVPQFKRLVENFIKIEEPTPPYVFLPWYKR